MRYAYAGQGIGGAPLILVAHGAVGTLFIKHLGGSDFLAMAMGVVIGLSGVLRIPVSLRVRPTRGKRFMLRCWAAAALIMGSVALLPFVSGLGSVTAVAAVVVIALATLINQLGSTFWFPLLHDVIPQHRRGRFFGRLRALWSVVLLAGMLLCGLFLGENPDTWRYQLVIGVAAVLILLRNVFVARIPENTRRLAGDRRFSDWRGHVGRMLANPQVSAYCLYFAAFTFCFGFMGRPLVLYLRFLGMPTNRNLYVTAFRTVGMIAAFTLGGQLVDRVGTKRVFLGAHLTLCLLAFTLVFVTMLPMDDMQLVMGALMVVAGSVGAVAGLSNTAQLFHLAPATGRAFFLSLAGLLIFVGPALSGLSAGAILSIVPPEWRWEVAGLHLNIYQIMLLFAGTGLLSAIGLLRRVEGVGG